MNQFDIFKSEGGFRVAGSVYAGSPVIAMSPWFPTIAGAEKAQQAMVEKTRAALAETIDALGITEADLS